MQIKIPKKISQAGTALLVALVMGGILCISITGYLSVTEQQNFLVTRSQAWNMAIVVTEAGIEEGLEHLNVYGTGNLGADSWTYDGTWYNMSRTLPSGDSYKISINVTNSANPVLICNSTVASTTWIAKNSSPFFFATAGGNTTTTRPTVQRAIQVKCHKGNLFTAALVAKHGIDLKGNGVYTDSYDSTDFSKSTGGKYDSSKYSGDKGDIATNGGVDDSVGVQNANIYGKVHTGINCPVSVGSQGGVGTHSWQAGNSGFEPNYVLQDANFTFPDTSLPDTTGYLTPTGPYTNTSSTTVYSTNQVANSTTYPNPVPWTGVTTNIAWATNGSYPGPQMGLVTNAAASQTSVACPAYPAPGTYVGAVTTNQQFKSKQGSYPQTNCFTGLTPNGSKWDYYLINYSYYPIANYAYQVPTYTYANYTTNSYTTNTVYDYILHGDSKYVATTGLNNKTAYIEGANVTLVLPNGMSGGEGFTWNTGASLLIYAGGTSIGVSGNGYINPNGTAGSLIIYAAPTVTSFTLSGNGQFTGVLVAPNADLTLNGGGNSNEDFCGSIMVNSARMNGHFSFHYDESLSSNVAGNARFLVNSWDEIDPNHTP